MSAEVNRLRGTIRITSLVGPHHHPIAHQSIFIWCGDRCFNQFFVSAPPNQTFCRCARFIAIGIISTLMGEMFFVLRSFGADKLEQVGLEPIVTINLFKSYHGECDNALFFCHTSIIIQHLGAGRNTNLQQFNGFGFLSSQIVNSTPLFKFNKVLTNCLESQ